MNSEESRDCLTPGSCTSSNSKNKKIKEKKNNDKKQKDGSSQINSQLSKESTRSAESDIYRLAYHNQDSNEVEEVIKMNLQILQEEVLIQTPSPTESVKPVTFNREEDDMIQRKKGLIRQYCCIL